MTDDVLLAAAHLAQSRAFVRWLGSGLILAAEMEPEMVRTAIAKLFDLTAVKTVADRADAAARESLSEAHRMATEVRALAEQVEKTLAGIEARQEALIAQGKRITAGLNRLDTNGQPQKGTTTP